jgi:hypothetical protein
LVNADTKDVYYNTASEYTVSVGDEEKIVVDDRDSDKVELLPVEIDSSHSLWGNVISVWHMDTGFDSGSDVEDSKGSRDGTAFNATLDTTNQKVGDGCGSFNGNAYITAPTISISDNITVSCWAYSTNFSWKFLVQKAPVNTQWELFFDGSLKWRGGGSASADAPLPSNNQWHHFVGTQSGTSASIYVDGVLVANGTVATMGNGTGLIWIGAHDNNGFYFNGLIDEVVIFNKVLSSSEIQTLIYPQDKPYVKYTTAWDPPGDLNSLNSITPSGVVGTVEYSFEIDGVDKWWNKTAGAWEPNSGELREGDDLYDSANLVSVWHMDNDAWDDPKGGNDGDTVGGDPSFTTSSKIGSHAGDFDGDDYVNIGDPIDGSLDFGTGSFTLSAWVNLGANGGVIINKRNGAGSNIPGYMIRITSVVLFRVSDGDECLNESISTDIRNDGKWHHVVARLNTTTNMLDIFLDGVKGTGTPAATLGDTSNDLNFLLGSWWRSDTGFFPVDGTIDEVAIWNRALTPAEIRRLYADQKNNKHSNTEAEIDVNLSDPSLGISENSTVNPIAYLISDGIQEVELGNLQIDYTVLFSSDPVNSFVVNAPASAGQDVSFSLTVTAKDGLNGTGLTTTGVSGDVTLTVDDGDIVYSPSPIPASEFQNDGVWTGNVSLNTFGTRTITATHGSAVGQDVIEIQLPPPLDKEKDVDYNTASEYIYDNTLIEFSSGMVSLSGSGTYSIDKPYVKYDTDFIWRPLDFDKLNCITPSGVVGTVEYSFEIDGIDKWWDGSSWVSNDTGELRLDTNANSLWADLVSVWHLNESSGMTAADSKGGNTGNLKTVVIGDEMLRIPGCNVLQFFAGNMGAAISINTERLKVKETANNRAGVYHENCFGGNQGNFKGNDVFKVLVNVNDDLLTTSGVSQLNVSLIQENTFATISTVGTLVAGNNEVYLTITQDAEDHVRGRIYVGGGMTSDGYFTLDNWSVKEVANGPPDWVAGKLNNALSFDGIDDYIKINNQPIFTNALTVSAWLYWTGGNPNYIVHSPIGIAPWDTWRVSRNGVQVYLDDSNSYSASGTIISNEWVHVMLVFDGDTLKFYQNGEMKESVPAEGTLNYSSTYGVIEMMGWRGQANHGAAGRLDEVAIWNRALTPDEVRRLYADQKNNKHSNTEAEIDANLADPSLGISENSTVNPIAYLISDGIQAVELDNLQIGYTPSFLSPFSVDSFVITAPSSAGQNISFPLIVKAKDISSITTTGVSGDVTLSANTGTIVPDTIAQAEFTDDGIWTGNVILNTAGTQTITATHETPSATGDSNTIEIQPPVNSFEVVIGPSTAGIDKNFSITVTAKDSSSNTTKSVTDNVELVVDTPAISYSPSPIPASEFQNDGVWTGNVSLSTAGTRTVTARLQGTPSTSGSDTIVIGFFTINSDTIWKDDREFPGYTVIITDNAVLTFDSIYKVGGAGQITLTCDNLIIDSGAKISADGTGKAGGGIGEGDGGGGKGTQESGGGGGGYGGYGGVGGLSNAGTPGDGGSTYGSVTEPINLGSGGGGCLHGKGGRGGGSIRLYLSGTLTNNGSISVNGGNGYDGWGGAGGSGGSIWVSARNLAGSGFGTFSAKGGPGDAGGGADVAGGGGGGGGRIAIWCPTQTPEDIKDLFNNLSAPLGGNGAPGVGQGGPGENGEVGTLYIHKYPSTTVAVE